MSGTRRIFKAYETNGETIAYDTVMVDTWHQTAVQPNPQKVQNVQHQE